MIVVVINTQATAQVDDFQFNTDAVKRVDQINQHSHGPLVRRHIGNLRTDVRLNPDGL